MMALSPPDTQLGVDTGPAWYPTESKSPLSLIGKALNLRDEYGWQRESR